MINTNPLQQYFRKPNVYVKLPSGDQAYDSSVLSSNPTGEHAVYSMTALDEIAIKTPDALMNGQAMIDVIQSCIPDIKDAWQLKVQDLDTVLIAIRIASGNGAMDITSSCPSCSTDAEYTVDLAGMLRNLKPGDYDSIMDIDPLKIKFKSITYQAMNHINMQQFEIQSKFSQLDALDPLDKTRADQSANLVNKLRMLTTEILALSVEYIETPENKVSDTRYILDFLSNCDRNIHNDMRDHAIQLRESSTIKPLDVKCSNCGHEYKQGINMDISNFFD